MALGSGQYYSSVPEIRDGAPLPYHSPPVLSLAYSLEEILEQLNRWKQRATYGAVAGLIDRPPMYMMNGRPRDEYNSWIVSKETRKPSKYEDHQCHADLESRDIVLQTPDELTHWLEGHLA